MFDYMPMSIDISGDWNHDSKPKLGEVLCPMECPRMIPADYDHLTSQVKCSATMERTLCKTVRFV